MTILKHVLLVYLMGVAIVTLYWIPGNMRRASEHVRRGESNGHFLPVFVSLVSAVAGGIFWPWNLFGWVRWRLAERRRVRFNAELIAILRKAVAEPRRPKPPCADEQHDRSNPCPRCRQPAYCDDCASCDSCRFAAPWANDFDPWGACRHASKAPPAATRCGHCGGVPIHTRFCSATQKAVDRSIVTRA